MPDSNPIDLPEDWDYAEIAGVETPGLCKVTGCRRLHKWDKKTGPGTSGSVKTYRGKDDKPFTVTLKLWEREHFDAWNELRALIEPSGNKQALDFYHPTADDCGIKAIIVEEIGGVEHKGAGLFEVEISVSEYRPPAKGNASGTPNGSKANAGAGGVGKAGEKAPTAMTEQEKEIQRLLKIAKEP